MILFKKHYTRLSAIVYEDVQEYELKKASRIHLFQSKKYSSIIKSGKSNNILSSLSETIRFPNIEYPVRFFIVRSRYAITVATSFHNTVILAVRGTVFKRLWDWKTNVDMRKYHIHFHRGHCRETQCPSLEDTFFHRGFFEAIVPQIRVISDEIISRFFADKQKDCYPHPGERVTVIWTGHSLGGAMAAIGNAIFHSELTDEDCCHFERELGCAYTFGMPRYCGLGAACLFHSPYHIFKRSDLVPTIPLRSMGFVDSANEYEITDSGEITNSERTDTLGVAGHVPRLFSSIHNHSIEGYVMSLSKAYKRW